MKSLTNIVLISLAMFVLTACNDEIGTGTNQQPTAQQKELLRDPATATELYGEIVHHGSVAPQEKVLVSGQDVNETLTLISILTKGSKSQPGTAFLLACDKRGGEWGLGSNIYGPNGESTELALDIAIMNFPAGLTDIREADDSKRAYFSTAEGDSDIVGALKGLKDLDPESTIVFVVEETKSDGYRYSTGWSPMFKVKDVVEGLKKVNLTPCAGLHMAQDYYSFMPNETLIPSKK